MTYCSYSLNPLFRPAQLVISGNVTEISQLRVGVDTVETVFNVFSPFDSRGTGGHYDLKNVEIECKLGLEIVFFNFRTI